MMRDMLQRVARVAALCAVFAGLYGCEDAPVNSVVTDPCGNACLGETRCVDGRCTVADVGAPDASSPDAVVDAAPPIPDVFAPECRGLETRRCVHESGCVHGRQRCEAGRFGPCELPEERCDGIDTDCDGVLDEGFGVGEACSAGLGQCARDGVLRCGASGDAVCNASAAEPLPERCNDLDDDCDGRVDEAFVSLGELCGVGVGACEAEGVVVCAADGLTECTAVAGMPGVERCDGQDRDCDGAVDESDPDLGLACLTDDFGRCATGVQACREGALQCVADHEPRDEVCDGLDDDCDGAVDEEGPPRGTGCDTDLPGICTLGSIGCDVDGTWTCQPVFQREDETCDGRDNDCDGYLDEADPDIGQLCETGAVGACAQGLLDCRDGAMACVDITEPIAETCDGVDDDCDGAVDEDTLLERPFCHTGQRGVCDDGYQSCVDGEVACLRAAPPADELCDGLDNDCDGLADEVFPGLGQRCGAGVGACLAQGIIGCTADRADTVCLANPGAPEPELCDEIDNDCDGVVDNFVEPPSTPEHCGACGRACVFPQARGRCEQGNCGMGLCLPDWFDLDGVEANGCEWTCTPTVPALEVCDGFDNDCDGRVDGPQCDGDDFRLCEARAMRGAADVFCDSFLADEMPPQYWPTTAVGPGDGMVTRLGEVRGDVGFEGGGITRRVWYGGPGFALGFQVNYRDAPVGVGLFRGRMPGVDDEALDDEDLEGAPDPEDGVPMASPLGYRLRLDAGADGPEGTITRTRDDAILWRGGLPELGDGARHWIRWLRLSSGGWRVEIDGRVIHPLETVDDDQAVTRFDQVSVWIGPSGGVTSGVNGIALQYDADGDDIYQPLDNCPNVFNPDQFDGDGNGRGVACDDRDADGVEDEGDVCVLLPNPAQIDADDDGVGDACAFEYGVAIGAAFGSAPGPWTLDLVTGQYQPVSLSIAPGDGEFAASRDGWWAWTRAGAIYVQGPDAEAPVMVAEGQRPGFMGETLIFVSPAADAVMRMPRDASAPPVALYALAENAPAARLLTAHVASSEAQVMVLMQSGDDDVRLVEVDGEGQERGDAIPIPTAGDGAFPTVDRHPSQALYLVAADGGLARGITLIDAAGNSRNIALGPTYKAVFTPSGAGVLSLSPGADGPVVMVHDLDPDGHPPTVILGDSQFIDSATLIAAPRRAIAPDSDHDGRPDAVDYCAHVPPLRSIEHRPLDGIEGDIDFYRLEDSFFVSWSSVERFGDRRLGFARLSDKGEVLAHHLLPVDLSWDQAHNLPSSLRRHAFPVWRGDGYDLYYSHESMHPDYDGRPWWRRGFPLPREWAVRDVFRVPLAPDWQLGRGRSVFEGMGSLGGPDGIYGMRPKEWVTQRQPWGYRLSAIGGAGSTRQFFDVATDGRILDRESTGPALPRNCTHGIPLRQWGRPYTRRETLLLQCAQHNQLEIYRLNTEGGHIDTSVVALGRIRHHRANRLPYVETHDVAMGAHGGMSVFVSEGGHVHARGIDHDAVLASPQRIVSSPLEGSWSVAIGAGDDRYGVVFTRNAGSLHFVAVDLDANPIGEPVELAPPGSTWLGQDLQVEWDGAAWVVLWRDRDSRIQFTRGRFDCR